MAEKLNVITDIQQAVKYEEFMASMSRRYMDDMTKVLRGEILEHAQKRASDLMQQYTRLRSLYAEQDALIGKSNGSINDFDFSSSILNLMRFFLLLLSYLFEASFNGGNYTNASEQQMDEDLESARQIRDKLGGAAEQWRTAVNLLRASAKAALIANEQWTLITSSRYDRYTILQFSSLF